MLLYASWIEDGWCGNGIVGAGSDASHEGRKPKFEMGIGSLAIARALWTPPPKRNPWCMNRNCISVKKRSNIPALKSAAVMAESFGACPLKCY
jgi:hypothetical protein